MSPSTLPFSDKRMAFDTCEICDPLARRSGNREGGLARLAEAEREGGACPAKAGTAKAGRIRPMRTTNLCVAAALLAVTGLLGDPILRAQAPPQEVGSARVVPIQITGDPAARFSMVVMGDGYTAADMPRFRAHLDKHLNVLWSIEPFRSYRNYINVYSVEIVSRESGITCDPEVRCSGARRPSASSSERVAGCTNINARGITPARARRRLIREYAAQGHTATTTRFSSSRTRTRTAASADRLRPRRAAIRSDRSSRRTNSDIRWDG